MTIPCSPARLAAVLAALALTAGCATTGGQKAVDPIAMEGMRFATVEVNGHKRVEVLDAEALFREGGRAFEAGDFATAAVKYRLSWEHFPESRWAVASLYNGALALERDGRCAEAVPSYDRVAEATAGSKDAHDALFRSAGCHIQLEQWKAADTALTRVLKPEHERIQPTDRLEAHALRGQARQRHGDLALAERDYQAALRLYRKHLDQQALVGNPHVSLAQYHIGEIYRELFDAIHFRLPVDRMMRDLEDKSNLFLKAQNAYLRAVRLHHPEWAVKAGYRLGALYETFYDDMMAAEVPPELDREEVEVYFEELRAKIRPLIVRAIDIYERNLQLGQRMGQGGEEWVRKTESSLARLKEVLKDDAGRDALARIK